MKSAKFRNLLTLWRSDFLNKITQAKAVQCIQSTNHFQRKKIQFCFHYLKVTGYVEIEFLVKPEVLKLRLLLFLILFTLLDYSTHTKPNKKTMSFRFFPS